MKLQASLNDIKAANIQVVAVSYDSQETLKEFSAGAEIEFPLLADPTSAVIDAYGIRNHDVEAGSRQDGIPHPGTFVVDADGVIRAKLFYSVRHRHAPQELIDIVNGLKAPTP